MKFRSGFVSNSSSSSFIVGFPEIPTSPEALEKMMFGKSGEVGYYEESLPTLEVARTVFHDIQNGKKLTKKKAIDVLLEGHFPGRPPYKFSDEDEESTNGYTIDNIQWIHKIVNIMKQDLTEDQFIQWCNLVIKNKSYAS